MKFNIFYIAQAFKPSYKLSHVGHHLWKQVIRPGDITIDATCGNGLDSLILAQACIDPLTPPPSPSSPSPPSAVSSSGHLYCFDVQQVAIDKTRARLEENGFTSRNVDYICGSHAFFPTTILPQSVACIVYNLGFLPGSDKSVVTKTDSTLASLTRAVDLIQPGGLVSVMAYQGHRGGGDETQAVIDFFESLPLAPEWRLGMYGVENQPVAPVLITAHRRVHDRDSEELSLPPPSNADVFARKQGN